MTAAKGPHTSMSPPEPTSQRRKVSIDLLIVVALSAFAWGALLAPGYFLKAHDAPHSVFYLLEFDKAFRDGNLYPRWGIDFALGYGYPLFSYYSPLAYYVAECFHLLGAGLTDAVKMTYILATVGSGLSMYGFVRRLFGRNAGLLAAVVFMFIPYHLVDLYERASFAEYCAFAFLPLVFWAFWELISAPTRHRLALAALAYAGLIMTHNATFLMATPLLALYCLYLLLHQSAGGTTDRSGPSHRTSTVQRLSGALGAALLAFALSAALLFPALLERDYIAQEQWTQGSFNYLKHFIYPAQLLSPIWGYGYAGEGPFDDVSLQLGLVAVVLSVMAVIWRPRTRRGQWMFFFVMTCLLVFLMLPLSSPLWQALPIVNLVQFPWRLLILTALTLSVTAGGLIAGLPRDPISGRSHTLDPAVVVVCLLTVLASQHYAVPQFTAHDPRSETEKAIIDFETFHPPDRVGMTAWVREQPQDSPLVEEYLNDRPLTRAQVIGGTGRADTLRSGGASIEAEVEAESGAAVQFYVYYFPGWEARVDGEKVPTRPESPHALLTIDVPPGRHRVELRYTDTAMGKAGKLVSALALLAAVGALCLRRKT